MRTARAQSRGALAALSGVVLLSVLVTGSGRSRAQQERGEPQKRAEPHPKTETASKRLEDLRHAAENYRITLDSEPPRTLVLKPDPVLRWSNPLRRTDDGAVFIWVSEGRPEVVASFYRHRREEVLQEDHEFQSLATTPLRAARDGSDVWFPPGGGVSLTPIPDAPPPAATPAERLRQMRALAREFKAFFNLPKEQSELRLLSQPIYRYETHRADVADGALFAFVQTTDPEVLLLIEARPHAAGLAWHYGIARMSMVNLRAEHKERTVWTADWDDQAEAPNKPYATLPGPRRNVVDDPGESTGSR
ncbi:MAG: hypothetical protein P4L84_20945 [Isosphaeraceae bacterium]|nr:hypothetical protein [Isosphaeraceae bacterium]